MGSTPHRRGRLYYVVNTVREVLETKDLETLHKVAFLVDQGASHPLIEDYIKPYSLVRGSRV